MAIHIVETHEGDTVVSSRSLLKINRDPTWKKRFAFLPTRVEIQGRKTIWRWLRTYEKYQQQYENGLIVFRRSSPTTTLEKNFFIMIFDYR